MSKQPDTYTFQRYLAAKRTIDDRALNHHVWESLHSELTQCKAKHDLTMLEIGGGIGTMIERLLEDGRLTNTTYHLVDEQHDNIATASQCLTQRYNTRQLPSTNTGFQLPPTQSLILTHAPSTHLNLHLYASDLFDFLNSAGPLSQVDLLLAHAFMDLVDIPSTLLLLTQSLQPGALLYFTINFDGTTILEPTIDTAFDAHIEAIYHRTMDERITAGKPSGDSHTGRHLYHQMQTANIHTIDAGSSDWVVIPHHRSYPHDEGYFLHFIINTMYGALRDHPDMDRPRFEQWIATRHTQIEQGELVYIAHQLDYLGKYQPPTP